MSDSTTPVPYETDAPNAYQWTTTAFDYLEGGKLSASVNEAGGVQTANVHGACPRCGDAFNFSQVLDAVTGESAGVLGRRFTLRGEDYVPLTVSCWCTEPHEGRPKGVDHGCGINFRVDVLPGAEPDAG